MRNRLLERLGLLTLLWFFFAGNPLFSQCTCFCPGTGVCQSSPDFEFSYCGPDTLYLDANCEAVFGFGGSPPGACSVHGNGPGTPTGVDAALTGLNVGDVVTGETMLTVFFVVTDDVGNQDTFSFPMWFVDTLPPDPVTPPSNTIVQCDGGLSISSWVDLQMTLLNNNATDNCGLDTITHDFDPANHTFADTTCGIVLVTFTLKDVNGNEKQVQATFETQDTVAPTFTIPPDLVRNCQDPLDTASTGNYANLMDNCDPNPTIAFAEVILPGACPFEITIQRTWTAVDACGNSRAQTQTITVVDNEAPDFDAPADLTVDCQDANDLNITGQPIPLGDNCDPNPKISFSDLILPGSCPNSFTIERTWSIEDTCGNRRDSLQVITVIDTLPPDIFPQAQNMTIACMDPINIDSIFNAWVMARGNAAATDNCSSAGDLSWAAFNSGTADPAALPPPNCPSPDSGIFRRQMVTFVVEDECGNKDSTQATFTVEDFLPPQLSQCPPDITVPNDPGACEAFLLLPLPMIEENCGNFFFPDMAFVSRQLTAPPGDPLETPVDIVPLEFFVPGPPFRAVGPVTLQIDLLNVDAESPTEFFRIIGEDGTDLGQTNLTPQPQCNNSTTVVNLTEEQFNSWGFDGLLEITLIPNVPPTLPGRFAINLVCGNSFVDASLSYTLAFPNSLEMELVLDGQPPLFLGSPTPVPLFLDVGVHQIEYRFRDCGGNLSTCSFEVTVEDLEPPALNCPPDLIVNLDPGECQKTLEVPLFLDVSDNCAVTTPVTQTQPPPTQDAFLTFTLNPNFGEFMADDRLFVFTNLQPTAAPGFVELIVELQGDVDEPGEFFTLIGPNNDTLGTTEVGQPGVVPGDCNSPLTATFLIPSEDFNNWASSGTVAFQARSFMSFPLPPSGPGLGINPCDPGAVTQDGQTDSISYMRATLQYQVVEPTYWAEGATPIPPTVLSAPLVPPTHTFDQGVTTISYEVVDLAGNRDTCSFDIVVEDKEPPNVLCGPSFVSINPSGLVQDTIFPADIDLGTSDNCTLDSIWVQPNRVTCDQAGSPINVTLFARDQAGNVDSCQTFVVVETEPPAPTVVGTCGSSDLQLMANPPLAPNGNDVYQYEWTGPNGFFSNQRNPLIQGADMTHVGFYTLLIRGITGCEAVGTVQIQCEDLPLQRPALSVSATQVCNDDPIDLSTSPVCGNVVYKWYSGTPPNGTLLGTTTDPEFTIAPPHQPGNFKFYVVVERNGCPSQASLTQTVTITNRPVAMPDQTSITVCEGEDILLGASVSPSDATCQWTGPCGFSSSSCDPAPILNASACHEGVYQLIATKNGCSSVVATVVVTVLERPATPQLTNPTTADDPVCESEPLTLTATPVPGAVSYEWMAPNFNLISTSGNTLTLPSVDASTHGGDWKVRAIGNPCVSEFSNASTVYVALPPASVSLAANPNPACEGQDVQLSASAGGSNLSFEWTYPDGQTSALQNPLLPAITKDDEGVYELVVSNEFGCSTEVSLTLDVIERVNITGVASNAPSCTTGPVDVTLQATVFPLDDGSYTYLWTGPNGYQSTNAAALIPNATADDSGPYTLVVTNADGCTSLPATLNVVIPEAVPTPGVPTLSEPNPFCEGESVSLSTAPVAGNQVEYQWSTPTGTVTTSVPSLTLNDLSRADSGSYQLVALVDGCPSLPSGMATVVVKPTPLAQASSNSPVCEGETLNLEANCSAGAMYEWTGPAGFNASVCNPVITNVDADVHSGQYTLRKKVDGCWSETVTLNVLIAPKPTQPVVAEFGPYCSSSEDVVLQVTFPSATPGATYEWFEASSNQFLGSTQALVFEVPNAESYGNACVDFYVIAMLDGCTSAPSLPMEVCMNVIPPNAADAGPDISVCEGQSVMLLGQPPSVGTGRWELLAGDPTGVTITNPDQAQTTVLGLQPGVDYVFRWYLSNGACVDYDFDDVSVFVDVVEDANAGPNINLCNVTSVTLDAEPPISGTGKWTQPEVQAQLGVTIVDPFNPQTPVNGLVPGNSYIFTWTVSGGCGESSDVVLVQISNEIAFAGQDFTDCGDGCTQLAAAPAGLSGGVWTSPDPELDIISPNDPTTFVCNLKNGDNILIWTIADGACGENSVDTLVISYLQAPETTDDVGEVGYAQSTTLNVLANDDILEPYTFNILQEPMGGSFTFDPEGNISYHARVDFVGSDLLVYEVCHVGCPDCSVSNLILKVGADAECDMPSIITPNNDGINDAFIVPCLLDSGAFPNSRLSIFNQWGDEVFRAQPYRNDWRGTHDGEDLPPGTYFYILDLGNGEAPTSGFLIIQR